MRLSTPTVRGPFVIIGLQETHLQGDTVGFLQYAWVGKAYHSTYSAFFRRLSVLIHKALAYQELDSLIDISGRFVFLYCKIYSVTMILVFVYIPPHSHRRCYSYCCLTWLTNLTPRSQV